MNNKINKLIEKQLVYKGARELETKNLRIPSGIWQLDQTLGGWPSETIIELIHSDEGIGEISLLLPLISNLSNTSDKWVALINPPYIPYAPTMNTKNIDISKILIIKPQGHKEMLWAMEQTLRAKTCSAVIGWPKSINDKIARRLRVAARIGKTIGFYLIQKNSAPKSSSAPYRLQVNKNEFNTQISILKTRDGKNINPFAINNDLAMSKI